MKENKIELYIIFFFTKYEF